MQNKRNDLLLVFTGGAIGTLLRFYLGFLTPDTINFPLSTLTINIIGSFGVGILFGLTVTKSANATEKHKTERQRLFFGTGLLGGFTTYSGFTLEAVIYSSVGLLTPVIYIAATLTLGTLAAILGIKITAYKGTSKN